MSHRTQNWGAANPRNQNVIGKNRASKKRIRNPGIEEKSCRGGPLILTYCYMLKKRLLRRFLLLPIIQSYRELPGSIAPVPAPIVAIGAVIRRVRRQERHGHAGVNFCAPVVTLVAAAHAVPPQLPLGPEPLAAILAPGLAIRACHAFPFWKFWESCTRLAALEL